MKWRLTCSPLFQPNLNLSIIMRCHSCNSKLGIIRNFKFIINFYFKKTAACPYCDENIYKGTSETWEHFKLIFYFIFWIGFVFFILALIFARQVDFKFIIRVVCFWYFVVAVGSFILIIFFHLILKLFHKIFTIITKDK